MWFSLLHKTSESAALKALFWELGGSQLIGRCPKMTSWIVGCSEMARHTPKSQECPSCCFWGSNCYISKYALSHIKGHIWCGYYAGWLFPAQAFRGTLFLSTSVLWCLKPSFENPDCILDGAPSDMFCKSYRAFRPCFEGNLNILFGEFWHIHTAYIFLLSHVTNCSSAICTPTNTFYFSFMCRLRTVLIVGEHATMIWRTF